jgi:hypothetical protein
LGYLRSNYIISCWLQTFDDAIAKLLGGDGFLFYYSSICPDSERNAFVSDKIEVSEEHFNKCISTLASLLHWFDLYPLSMDFGVRMGRLSLSSCRTQ